MGRTQNFTCRQTLQYLTISLLILMISSLSQLTFKAEGRELLDTQTESVKRQIGSRPPTCDKRCGSCRHCEAIQVPTNPQITNGDKNNNSIANARDSDNSNYKPMSWKCRCGNLIFNP